MNDKTPASLTSSLLARKGSAAPAAEALDDPDGAAETVSHADGAPDDPDSQESFLTRGPDPVMPDPGPEPSPLGGALDDDVAEPTQSRRAPLIILAILLVFVLAGAGWFAASVFLRGGEERAVAAMRTPPAARSTAHATAGLQPVVSQTAAPMAAPSKSPAADGGNEEPVAAMLSPVAAVEATEPAEPDASTPHAMSETAASEMGAPGEAMAGSPPAAIPQSVASAKKPAPPVPAPAAEAAPPAAEPAPPAAKPPQPAEKAEPAKVATVAKAAAKPAEPPPAPKPVRVAARPAGTHGVQLASVSTRAQANRALEQFSRKFASILDGTELRVRTATLKKHGTVYRIQTPAVLTASSAKRLCSRLKSARQACFVFSQ